MDLLSAKNMVAHKYFREKWHKLAPAEQLKHYDEVAQLYCESNQVGGDVNNMSLPVKLYLCQCENSKSVEVDLCTECFGVFHAVK